MSFTKNFLAVAIAGGLLSTAAQAVDISNPAALPVRIASEVDIPSPAGLVFTNTGALNISSQFLYNFSTGEVRYARIECSNTITFEAGSTVALSGAGAVGAINGLGTNAINFSVTAVGASPVSATTLTVNGNRKVLAQSPVNCTYSLYDQPSQAAAGGPAGLIVTSSGAYLTFLSSFVFGTVTPNTSTSNVEAVPSFTGFVVPGNPTNNAGRAQLNRFEILPRSFVDAPQPIKANGLPSGPGDLGPTTSVIIDGDFSAAANADGTYTGAALSRVFLSNVADCSAVFPVTALTATSAAYPSGTGVGAAFSCYTPRAGALIPASTYALRWALVGTPGFTTSPVGPVAGGTIVRNGTELQAPLAQIPGGFISRLVLTNTGSVARTYTANVLRETGNTGTVGSAVTGTIPANGTVVVNMADLLGTFTTGQPRATVNVTVAGPNAQIQGLYQIVNPASGGISNHVMVRPGTN